MKKKTYAVTAIIFLFCFAILTGCTKDAIKSDVYNQLKEKGKLIIGTSTDYKPMEYHDEKGEIVGLDIDIAKEIASQMDLSLEIKDLPVWEELLDSASTGKIDLAISSMTITPEKSRNMLFSAPYFNGGQVIIVKNEDSIQNPEDLKDKKIAVIRGSTSEQIALQYVQSREFVLLYEDYGPELTMLLNGTVDALIIDYVAAVEYVKISSGKLKILGEPITQEYYGIASKRENEALMNEINRILRDMKRNGKLDEIQKKWLQ